MFKKTIIITISTAFIVSAVLVANYFIIAWTEPTVAPPGGFTPITSADWSDITNRPAGLDDGDDVGITSESDPTVNASVNDGVDWAEVTGRPADLVDGDQVGRCAFCRSCGGSYPSRTGRFYFRNTYNNWDGYGFNCSGAYGLQGSGISTLYLCCGN